LFSEKKQRPAFRFIQTGFLFFSFLLVIFVTSGVYGFSSRPVSEETVEFVKAQPGYTEPNSITARASETIAVACKLIYEGEFDEAGSVIRDSGYGDSANLRELLGIVEDYQQMMQRRRKEREDAYKKELAELEKLKVESGANKVSDINDVNDINDITKLLSVIARAAELAGPEQKAELLANPLVLQTFQRARDKASEFESEGKWLDSYLICYSWLAAIDEDNKEYSDYAEQLEAKANIVASFQDSPCESSRERYRGVTREGFINSIDVLKHSYVKEIIDYKQMIEKAINRCKQLEEVLTLSYSEISQDQAYKSGEGNSEEAVAPPASRRGRGPESSELAAWNRGLDEVLKDAKQWPFGVDSDKFIEVFRDVVELNKKTVELTETVLIAHFAEAALSALDPYTVIIWPQQTEEFDKMMTNEFTGIGVEISKPAGILQVGSLLPDTPAYNSGLDAGDIIEAVDGIPTKDMSLICAVKYITGPAGTDVKLTVRSPDEEKTRDITITRAKIVVRTIRGWQRTDDGKWSYMIDDKNKIGYVRITSFSEKTADDLEEVLDKLDSAGLKAMILDLRFNSGGLLSSATEVVDKFVSKGIIVSTRYRYGLGPFTAANRKETHPDYPLVVLINSNSASASEIVAGSLADKVHERAILVGERTHGKGSVQTITARPGGGAQLKYTMAYYHLPSSQRVESREAAEKQGRSDWGIGPDIEVKMGNGVLAVSDELKKMLELRRDNDVLVRSDHKKNGLEKKHTIEETLESDPQLTVAVLAVKAKLIERQNAGLKYEALQAATN